MTHKQFLVFVAPVLFFLVILGYCVPKKQESDAASARVKGEYEQNISRLDAALMRLRSAVAANAPAGKIQREFYNARLNYKKMEYLVEYFNPYTAKAMNGPPVAEVEEDDPSQNVVKPTGFQVVEELLFPQFDAANREEALRGIGILQSAVKRLRLVTQTTPMADRHVFDAMRQQVYRVITLGITGFDSPVAGYSLAEAAAALSSLKQTFLVYQPGLSQKSPELAARVCRSFDQSIGFLQQNTDFDRFDRAVFIAGYANQLSSALAEAGEALDIPVPAGVRVVTAGARTLFDKDAFDPNYYAPGHDAHLTAARAGLGKTLFFDPILSGNNSRSCASCHNPEKAFTDGKTKSTAFDFKGQVSRNSPTILNAALQRSLFYDMRVVFLEDQASDVLANEREMHGSFGKAATLVARSPEYLAMFRKAFPGKEGQVASDAVTEQQIKVAIASYIRSLTAMDSRFDQYMRGDKTQLTAIEKNGLNLFTGKARCATCHFLPLFNGTVPPAFDHTEAEIIGVPSSADTLRPVLDPDPGRYHSFRIDLHRFAFKTPTLRNIVLTAPYMHNGVYNTLEEVVDFYNKGGGAGMGIPVPNQTLPAEPLHLTFGEKQALIAFMEALTDTSAVGSRPGKLPAFPSRTALNKRLIGGKY